jgi:hypothetical protein
MGMSPTSGLMNYLVNITGKSMTATLRYDEVKPKEDPTNEEL